MSSSFNLLTKSNVKKAFSKFCVSELDIKITSFQLRNKFDYRDSKINKYFLGRILIASYFKILYCIKFPLLFAILHCSLLPLQHDALINMSV